MATQNTMCEQYRYSGQGLRMLKFSPLPSSLRRQEARYLPSLEMRLPASNSLTAITIITLKERRIPYWIRDAVRRVAVHQQISDRVGNALVEVNDAGQLLSHERYYPFGGTALWATPHQLARQDKQMRFSGKERDDTGLYYFGFRYYSPWLMRWLNADPAGTTDGLNLFSMVRNNPQTRIDADGCASSDEEELREVQLTIPRELVNQSRLRWQEKSDPPPDNVVKPNPVPARALRVPEWYAGILSQQEVAIRPPRGVSSFWNAGTDFAVPCSRGGMMALPPADNVAFSITPAIATSSSQLASRMHEIAIRPPERRQRKRKHTAGTSLLANRMAKMTSSPPLSGLPQSSPHQQPADVTLRNQICYASGCESKFLTPSELTEHVIAVHLKTPCPHPGCEQKFMNKWGARRHFSVIHKSV